MPGLIISAIADLCQGEIRANHGQLITGANTIDEAGPAEVGFVANEKAAAAAVHSRAGCLLVTGQFTADGPWSVVRVENPRAAFARLLPHLYPAPAMRSEFHPSAVIARSAKIGHQVFIGPFANIGEEAVIGDGCYIGSHASIGDRVVIGRGTYLHPRVVLYSGIKIGDRGLLHSGCVIGADGFGFAFEEGRYQKFPQVGTVVLGDDVEVGANTCIDRAALGITSVGNGTKLDNLVHIGHNCIVGEHVAIAAQCGLSGGVVVGDRAVFGGQVGVGDRVTIAEGAIIGAQAGILPGKYVPAGEPVWGTPARPLRQHLKTLAQVAKLPAYKQELRTLKDGLARLWSLRQGDTDAS